MFLLSCHFYFCYFYLCHRFLQNFSLCELNLCCILLQILVAEGCLNSNRKRCIECQEKYNLTYSNEEYKCSKEDISKCSKVYNGTCRRCREGYYIKEDKCKECDSKCTTCYGGTEKECITCSEGYYLSEHTCKTNKELEGKCQQMMITGGCAICKEGYYKERNDCKECTDKCQICENGEKCTECSNGYFLTKQEKCKPMTEIHNCKVEIDKSKGCTECIEGYYVKDKECYQCSTECKTCSTESDKCTTCIDEYVLIENQCISYKTITSCKEAKESKCVKCTFWHKPNSDGTKCENHAEWWIILIIIIVVIIIILIIITAIYFIIKRMIENKRKKEIEKNATVFKIKKSNILFIDMGNGIVTNKNGIKMNEGEEMKVEEEYRELICIGNGKKDRMKIQISMKEESYKYSIRSEPKVVTLRKGEACEFSIYITIHCTCRIEDKIVIIGKKLREAEKEIITDIEIEGITEMTSQIDPDEIVEEKQIGEGSFGIVYIGTFRGNKVAIKKMKNNEDNEEVKEEFKKEVSMLDKFRNEYIIHFYGTSFIPNRICMVTEFAEHGSLNDLIKKRRESPINKRMRIKILLDSAKGISYLHNNGILHRDIKPDNILITSLDDKVEVNGKLTDFGSSRNINLLMTNMTFTKGIGTPVYMAPEVLNQEKYKKPADVYSFAVTMYECIKWGECYPTKEFKFPWKIAEYVMEGKRVRKAEEMREEEYSIIEKSWKQEPEERITIEEIVEELENIKNKSE